MAAPQQSKGRWFDSGSSDFLPFEIIIAGQNYLSDHFHLTVWRYCIWVMKENTNKQVTKRREVNEKGRNPCFSIRSRFVMFSIFLNSGTGYMERRRDRNR